MTEAVKVMVRCRPMSTKEKQRGCINVVQIDPSVKQVKLLKTGSLEPPKVFCFDSVFGVQSLQSQVYQQTAFSLVDNVLQGYNGTIFAYGQTGCGKTHTMMGSTQNEQSMGIIPRTFHQIVTLTNSQCQKKHLVRCSFIEIYNQQIHDLLGKDTKARMQLKQSPDKGVFVRDLSMNIVKTQSQMQRYMDMGFRNRAVRQTAMNKQSSRSHSLFTIHIQSQQVDELGNEKFRAGKLNLVDLAGSQRQSKTQATGDGMKQAAKINLSLSALGNVISALVDGKTQHIPYRDSKLTRLLQDSLGGNTKTIMIAALSPADYNYDQTLSTLRYASRAKFIQNKPTINQDPKDALLREYAQEIKKLKMMLQGKMPLISSSQVKFDNISGCGEKEMQTQIIYKQIFVQRSSNNNINGDNTTNNNTSQLTATITTGNSEQQLQNELRSKQDQLRLQQQQKYRLKQQMQNLQKLISHQEKTIDRKQIQRMNKLKQKLKQQKRKQQQYMNQKKKREQQLLSLQSSYKSLNEQVQVMRVKFAKIKAKYMQTLSEMRDIQSEHEREKEQLLNTIRSQQPEINKWSSITRMLLTNQQIDQIIKQSQFNQQTQQWVIAPFYYRERMVNFPKLPQPQRKEFIQNQKDKKEIVFKDMDNNYNYYMMMKRNQSGYSQSVYANNNATTSRNQVAKSEYDRQVGVGGSNAISKSKDSFKVSQVLKNARQQKDYIRDRQKSQYNNKNSIDFDKYEKYDNKSLGGFPTFSKQLDSATNPTPKVPKNTHLLPIKAQSQQRIKMDEMNLNLNGVASYNNAGSNSGQHNSAKNVKLNPIGGKREFGGGGVGYF